jgi:hypothetical protein
MLAFDAAHIVAAYFFGVHICHWAKLGAFYFLFSQNKNRGYLPAFAGRQVGLTFGANRYPNNIRFAGEAFIVELITVSICIKKFTNEHFRPGVFAFDLAHIVASDFFCMHIRHYTKLVKVTTNK